MSISLFMTILGYACIAVIIVFGALALYLRCDSKPKRIVGSISDHHRLGQDVLRHGDDHQDRPTS